MEENMKYYNSGTALGVVGTRFSHHSNDWTYLPTHWASNPWIRSEDLYDTREEALHTPKARFLGEEEVCA